MPLPSFLSRRRDPSSPGALAREPQSTQAMQLQAKQRLIGAGILVAVALVLFPWIFDTKPRPLPADLPIHIARPDGTVASSGDHGTAVTAPLTVAATNDTADTPQPAPAASAAAKTPPSEADRAKPAPRAEPTAAASAPAASQKPSKVHATADEDAAAARPAQEAPAPAKPKPAVSEAARAEALLEGRAAPAAKAATPAPAASAAAGQRFIVQVGAYADNAHAHEVRMKIEKLGLKTYVQGVDTSQGHRIRVRLGPYASAQEAAHAAARLKQAGLPGAVVPL